MRPRRALVSVTVLTQPLGVNGSSPVASRERWSPWPYRHGSLVLVALRWPRCVRTLVSVVVPTRPLGVAAGRVVRALVSAARRVVLVHVVGVATRLAAPLTHRLHEVVLLPNVALQVELLDAREVALAAAVTLLAAAAAAATQCL